MGCLYALPIGCCISTGPWDWYQDGGDSSGEPVIARTGSVYFDPHNWDDSSYTHAPTWSVAVPDSGDGRNFQNKEMGHSITPLGITESELVYCWLEDTGNHHVNKWWRFDSDAMGLTDAGNAANIAFDWNAGSIRFTSSINAATQTEYARTGDCTWEDWGVPSGATVTDVEIDSYRRKVESASAILTSHSLVIRIVNNSNANVVLSGDLVSATLPTTADSVFVTRSGGSDGTGTERTVDAAYDASTDTIRLQLAYTATRGTISGHADEVLRLDDIQLVIHFTSDGLEGVAKIDAGALDFEWAVTDADWFSEDWPIMGPVTIAVEDGRSAALPMLPDMYNAMGGSGECCHAGGLRKWSYAADESPATVYTYSAELWEIDDGDYSYTEWPTIGVHDPDNNSPFVPYPYFLGIPWWNDVDTSAWYNAVQTNYARPFMQASQCDLAIGVRYQHLTGLPDDPTAMTTSFTAQAEALVGAVDFDDDDLPGLPFVSGSQIWSLSTTGYYANSVEPMSSTVHPDVRVDAFDASPESSIAIITYTDYSDFEDLDPPNRYYAPNTETSATVLVVNGDETEAPIKTISYSVTTLDESDYYPRWVGVRALHTTEGTSENRCVCFKRYPFDGDDESSDEALREWTLLCFDGTDEDWTLTSRWGRNSRVGSGDSEVTLNATEGNFIIELVGITGSDPDYDVNGSGNLAITVNVDQVASGQPEKTSYSAGVLTVEIDIAGGHDTVADLIELIDEGGDFRCSAGDANTGYHITASTTGSDTLTGGSTAPNSSLSSTGNWPWIHDSSDRFMYVVNHPLRVYDVGATDITGRTRRRYCGGGDSYPTSWMITHDGSIINPVGEHANRWERGTSVSNPGDVDWSCIKNSDDVAPGAEEF